MGTIKDRNGKDLTEAEEIKLKDCNNWKSIYSRKIAKSHKPVNFVIVYLVLSSLLLPSSVKYQRTNCITIKTSVKSMA